MPGLVEHLDVLAIQMQRDVLFVVFPEITLSRPEWDSYSRRIELIHFLESHKIRWLPCAHTRSTNSVFMGYQGSIYLDVPFNLEYPLHQIIQEYLEHPNGTLRDPLVRFQCQSLAAALTIQKQINLDD